MKMQFFRVVRTHTESKDNYCSHAGVLVNLGDEIRLVRRLFSTKPEGESLGFGKLMVVVGVVERARRSFGEVSGEIAFVSIADGGLALGELTAVGVEGDGALRVIIFESSGFGESEANLGGRIVSEVLLDLLMANH